MHARARSYALAVSDRRACRRRAGRAGARAQGHRAGAVLRPSRSAPTTSCPNYTKFIEFVRKLDADSDRMTVQSIGKTAEGRDQLMAIITAPENFKNLKRYKDISRRLSLAEGLTDDQARALAKEGKAVVWIDGGLHATEVLGAQQLMETIYQLVSRNDEETMRLPARRHHPLLRTPIPTAWSWSPTGTCGSPRTKTRTTGRHPAALPEVRRARQQPRLLLDEPAGVHEHQPDSVSRVVPADHVQPSPDRARRHGDVLAALPRSVQLRLRPARRQQARSGRRRDAQPLRSRRASQA